MQIQHDCWILIHDQTLSYRIMETSQKELIHVNESFYQLQVQNFPPGLLLHKMYYVDVFKGL